MVLLSKSSEKLSAALQKDHSPARETLQAEISTQAGVFLFCAMYLWTKKRSTRAATVMASVQNIPADWEFKQKMFKC